LRLRKFSFTLFIYIKWQHNLDPDKNPDPQATAQFQAVAKAYKILGTPKLRATYDLLGSQGQRFDII
jgi:DnaJ-class molecular chaperone